MAITGLTPDEGLNLKLNMMFKESRDYTLHLYTTNVDPSVSDTSASYTEGSGFGYSAINIVDADWTITGKTAHLALKTFTLDNGFGTVYGAFVKHVASGKVIVAAKLPTPITISYNGTAIDITDISFTENQGA